MGWIKGTWKASRWKCSVALISKASPSYRHQGSSTRCSTDGVRSPQGVQILGFQQGGSNDRPSRRTEAECWRYSGGAGECIAHQLLPQLPDEILLQILLYIPTYQLLSQVGRVSRHFYRLSKDTTFLDSLIFLSDVHGSLIEKFIQKTGNIEELCIIKLRKR